MDRESSLSVLRCLRSLKQAQENATSGNQNQVQNYNQLVEAHNQLQNQRLIYDTAAAGLIGLGIGSSLRGLTGLYSQLRQKEKYRLRPKTLEVPFALPVRVKQSEEVVPGAQPPPVAQPLSSDPSTNPVYLPAIASVGTLGLGVGWLGTHEFLKNRRKKTMEQRLQRARKAFYAESMRQHQAPPSVKQSAADDWQQVDGALDALYQTMCGCLSDLGRVKNASELLGKGLGVYGAIAGPTAVLAGMFAYDRMRRRTKNKALERAVLDRQRMEASNPQPIYAYVKPV